MSALRTGCGSPNGAPVTEEPRVGIEGTLHQVINIPLTRLFPMECEVMVHVFRASPTVVRLVIVGSNLD